MTNDTYNITLTQSTVQYMIASYLAEVKRQRPTIEQIQFNPDGSIKVVCESGT